METYRTALERTDPERMPTLEAGSPEAEAAVARFCDFIAVMSPESMRQNVRAVYAEGVYFNDTLKEIEGVEALEAYLIESMEATESVTVEVKDVAVSGGNYYVVWEMEIRFKNLNGGRPSRTVGMSHIRFDGDGKVVLHRDYWDAAAGLFEHIPVLGRLIGYVKGRL